MNRMLVLAALTSAHEFTKDTYRRFAGSLAATGFDGSIVIFTTAREIADGDLLELQDEIDRLTLSAIAEMADPGDINCYRYRHFRDYLTSRVDDFDHVMLSDARDVIFQRDISRYPFAPDADLFLAEEEKLIGDCPINSGWILDLYGPVHLEDLKQRPILCSGTTLGSPPAMLRYLDAMIEQVETFDAEFRRRFGHLGGIDQGMHNGLYHMDLLPGLRMRPVPNSENMVYTVGHVAHDDSERPFLDGEGRFINQHGELCYCVHQFDRLDVEVRDAFNRTARHAI